MDIKKDVLSNWTFLRSQLEKYKIAKQLNKKENKVRAVIIPAVMDTGPALHALVATGHISSSLGGPI